jgi:hypothetical protein
VDVSAVAYFRVVDAVKSVVAIGNVYSAIDQIAQTTLRKVVGLHSLDQPLSETDKINLDIGKILDVSTVEWGVEVTLVELKDIQLPETMKRAMAKQAEAEREKRAKIINAQGESLAAAALGDASDIMMAHPLALQLRNLQSLVEIGVDKNTTVVFPAPLMTTIAELGAFLSHGQAAAGLPAMPAAASSPKLPSANGRQRAERRRAQRLRSVSREGTAASISRCASGSSSSNLANDHAGAISRTGNGASPLTRGPRAAPPRPVAEEPPSDA